MTLHLYNTLKRDKQAFVPMDENRVTMYVCGPTVYSYAHIGNGRSAVAFDVLFRVLRHHYGADQVIYARNITDVDDKINKAAKDQGVDISVITRKFEKIYQDDLAALGNLSPTIQPRATETIDVMIDMVKRLIDADHAYEAEGHVLFDVPSYDDYGQLSRRNRDDMIAGARVEVAPYKKDPADFVLWKPAEDDMPGWDSPWGRGRPGWHLECSAMSEKHLGETIDIHAGGLDLTFPHHENEIAQSQCSHGGKTFARYWMHNGFLNMGDEKMSKSLGNILLIHDLIDAYPPEAVRMALLSAHYRQPLIWTDALLEQSLSTLDKLYKKMDELSDVNAEAVVPQGVMDALNDDLNTPKAFAEIFALLKDDSLSDETLKGYLLGVRDVLGFLQQDPADWFSARRIETDMDESVIEDLIKKRIEAKANKDYATADKIRQDLADQGIVLEDSPQGTTWKAVKA